MEYLTSPQVKVFPTAHRQPTQSDIDQSGFRLSEEHLGQLLAEIGYRNKFVKETHRLGYDYLIIVLAGHIFEIKKTDIINLFSSDSNGDIILARVTTKEYAGIGSEIVTVETEDTTLDVNTGSSNWKFKGIGFTLENVDVREGENTIRILQRVSPSEWAVPAEAKMTILTEQVANSKSEEDGNTRVAGVPITERFDTQAIVAAAGHIGDFTCVRLNGFPVLDLIYPVGSIYTSMNQNEATIGVIGKDGCPIADTLGGKWEKIKGYFLVAAGNNTTTGLNFSVGANGGNKDLIVPYHNHSLTSSAASITTSGNGGHTHSATFSGDRSYTSWDGMHTHSVSFNIESGGITWDPTSVEVTDSSKIGTKYASCSWADNHRHSFTPSGTVSVSTVDNHTHTFSITPGDSISVDYAGTSGNTTNANLPPYLAVYMWKRISD